MSRLHRPTGPRLGALLVVAAVSLLALAGCSSRSTNESAAAKPMPEACETYLAQLRSCLLQQHRQASAIDQRVAALRAAWATESKGDALGAQCSASAKQLQSACF